MKIISCWNKTISISSTLFQLSVNIQNDVQIILFQIEIKLIKKFHTEDPDTALAG